MIRVPSATHAGGHVLSNHRVPWNIPDSLGNRSAAALVCNGEMALIGRLHPLLIHFPIALVIVALAAEVAAVGTGNQRWRTVAVANLWAGAAFGLLAAAAGWRLASMPDIERAPLLEWHRWLGTTAAGTTLVAALATLGGPRRLWLYRIALLAAGVLVGVTGHLGGLLVFGPDFFRFRS